MDEQTTEQKDYGDRYGFALNVIRVLDGLPYEHARQVLSDAMKILNRFAKISSRGIDPNKEIGDCW